jgi:hypothetical protein
VEARSKAVARRQDIGDGKEYEELTLSYGFGDDNEIHRFATYTVFRNVKMSFAHPRSIWTTYSAMVAFVITAAVQWNNRLEYPYPEDMLDETIRAVCAWWWNEYELPADPYKVWKGKLFEEMTNDELIRCIG